MSVVHIIALLYIRVASIIIITYYTWNGLHSQLSLEASENKRAKDICSSSF